MSIIVSCCLAFQCRCGVSHFANAFPLNNTHAIIYLNNKLYQNLFLSPSLSFLPPPLLPALLNVLFLEILGAGGSVILEGW